MEAKQRKRKKEIENTKDDRLSELPDCLLHHIFSFADTADVVRTCILSQRWRYFWISVPSLNFNFKNFSRVISSKESSFINFNNQVLLRRNFIPVRSFQYSPPSDVKVSAFQSWICYAINHQVQHLTLDVGYLTTPLHLPHCLNRCTSLTTLELSCSGHQSIKWPANFELPSLKNLHLVKFLYCSEESIFSCCPNLETLKLVGTFCGEFSVCALKLKSFDFLNNQRWRLFSNREFVIVAPKLMRFKFGGYPPGVFSPKNLCSLDHIEIDVPNNKELYLYGNKDMMKQKYALTVLQMLNAFPTAKTMTLSMNVIQVLSYVPALLNEHPSQFSNLKYLKVKSSKSSEKIKIPSFILNYFRTGSPLLEIS